MQSPSAATLQSGRERKAEDSSGPRAVSKIINDQHAILTSDNNVAHL